MAKLHQNGYSVASTIKSFGFDNENEYKEFYKFELAAKAGFDNFLNKDRIGAASATEDYFKDLIVVSYNEIESNVELQSVGMVTA